MNLYCGNCRFINTGVEGLKCKIYNNQLNHNNLEAFRLGKCKLENSKVNSIPEKK